MGTEFPAGAVLHTKDSSLSEEGWIVRVCVTNDDGIGAPGIASLVVALQSLGHDVMVVAPDSNQSGKSQSISLNQTLSVRPYSMTVVAEAFAVSGTPTDCVRLICAGAFGDWPAIILSGVNDGANLGSDQYLSGTVGAAREAALHRIPSIAWSTENMDSRQLACLLRQYLPPLTALALGHPGAFYNVNFPAAGGEDSAFTVPSPPWFQDKAVAVGSDQIVLLREMNEQVEEGTDVACVMAGLTSISPVVAIAHRRSSISQQASMVI